jgi:hypothetical protein
MEVDPYHEAALVYIVFICDICHAILDGEKLPGVPHLPDDGWFEALGDEARRRGWRVEHSGAENPFDYSFLCPDCARTTPKHN